MKKILLILSFLIIANIAEANEIAHSSGDIKGPMHLFHKVSGEKSKSVIRGTDISTTSCLDKVEN